MKAVKFTVPGEPKGKGRPRHTKSGHSYTPKETAMYENLVAVEYQRQNPGVRFPDGAMLDFRILAYYAIPKSKSRREKAAMLAGEIRPTKKPDMDNILKVVADALNQIAYRDDAQIVDTQVRKYYSDQPRLEVTILAANKRREQKS